VEENYERAVQLADIKDAFQQYASKDGTVKITVKNNSIVCNGEELHNALGTRLFELAKANMPLQFFVEFIARKNKNPSNRANEELFGMLDKNSLPITPKGMFHAYKAVKRHDGAPFIDYKGRTVTYNDYVDIYTGKMRCNVGDVNDMPRNEVCDDKHKTCAPGLHFTSLGYAKDFSRSSRGAIILVELDPADVVSIPVDYNHQKGRACAYKVVQLHTDCPELAVEAFKGPVSNVGYSSPDGDQYEVVSTNVANAGTVIRTFKKRKAAEEYCKTFSDVKIVDVYALAKLKHAESSLQGNPVPTDGQ